MAEMSTDRATDNNSTEEAWNKNLWLVGFHGINQVWNAPICNIVWLSHEHHINIFIINDLFRVGRL